MDTRGFRVEILSRPSKKLPNRKPPPLCLTKKVAYPLKCNFSGSVPDLPHGQPSFGVEILSRPSKKTTKQKNLLLYVVTYGQNATTPRLKSRKNFLSSTTTLEDLPPVARTAGWSREEGIPCEEEPQMCYHCNEATDGACQEIASVPLLDGKKFVPNVFYMA